MISRGLNVKIQTKNARTVIASEHFYVFIWFHLDANHVGHQSVVTATQQKRFFRLSRAYTVAS